MTILRKIGPVAYKLEPPPQWRVHDVFHVSLLRAYFSRGGVGHVAAPPAEWLANELLYEVEAILDHYAKSAPRKTRTKKPTFFFLVKWKGYDHLHNNWEPESNLLNCKDVLAQYWSRVNPI